MARRVPVDSPRDMSTNRVLWDLVLRRTQELHSSWKRLDALIERSSDGTLVVGEDGLVLFANRAAALLLGRTKGELLGLPFGFPLSTDGDAEVELRSDEGALVAEMRVTETVWDGSPATLVTLHDITRYRDALSELERSGEELALNNRVLKSLAERDPLTQVLNRRGLEVAMGASQEFSSRHNAPLIAALIDLDDFKQYNETYGHAVGDEVICGVAQRLSATSRSGDVVARVGGDEFLLLLADLRMAEGLHAARRVLEAISATHLPTTAGALLVTASIGVAKVPRDETSIEGILRATREALETSKAGGKNRVSVGEQPYARAGCKCLRVVDTESEATRAIEIVPQGVKGGLTLEDELLDRWTLRAAEMAREESCEQIWVPVDLQRLEPEDLLELAARLRELSEDLRVWFVIQEERLVGDPAPLADKLSALRERGAGIVLDGIELRRSSLEALILLEPDVVRVADPRAFGAADGDSSRLTSRRVIRVIQALGAEPAITDAPRTTFTELHVDGIRLARQHSDSARIVPWSSPGGALSRTLEPVVPLPAKRSAEGR